MQLPRFDREAEHPLQHRQLAIDLANRHRPPHLGQFLPRAVATFHPPRRPSQVRVGETLRDVRTDVARRDRRQPLVPEERREVLVDPPLGIDVGALAIRLVVVEHVFRGFVERDPADLGIDRDAALDVALASPQHPSCDGFVLRSCALAHRPTVLVVLDPEVRRPLP